MRKFLIVDSDPIFHELAAEYFGDGRAEVVWADRIKIAHDFLSRGGISVAIIALSQSGEPGLDLIKKCRVMAHTLDMPIIALIGSPNRQKIMEALQAGANAFAVKPVSWPLFECQIEYVSLQCHKVAALRKSAAQLLVGTSGSEA